MRQRWLSIVFSSTCVYTRYSPATIGRWRKHWPPTMYLCTVARTTEIHRWLSWCSRTRCARSSERSCLRHVQVSRRVAAVERAKTPSAPAMKVTHSSRFTSQAETTLIYRPSYVDASMVRPRVWEFGDICSCSRWWLRLWLTSGQF